MDGIALNHWIFQSFQLMASVTQTSPWLAHRDGNWTMPSDPVLAAIDLLPALGLSVSLVISGCLSFPLGRKQIAGML